MLTRVVYLALRFPSGPKKAGLVGGLDSMSISLFAVGVCSFAFHATLHQELQLCDDVSMLVLAGAIVHSVYACGQPPATAKYIAAISSALVLGSATAYLQSQNMNLHIALFGGLLTLIWPRTLFLIYGTGRSDSDKKNLMRQFWAAVGSLVLGFAIWNVDLEYCFGLRSIRTAVGLPLSWLLELHGWWHVLTAVGAMKYFQLVRNLDTPAVNKEK